MRGTRDEAPRCHLRAACPRNPPHQTRRRPRPPKKWWRGTARADRIGSAAGGVWRPARIRELLAIRGLRAPNLFAPLLIWWEENRLSFACTTRLQSGSALLLIDERVWQNRICDCGVRMPDGNLPMIWGRTLVKKEKGKGERDWGRWVGR